MFYTHAEQWADETFSRAKLGDRRRTKRLIKFTASLANHIGQSIVQSLKTPADIEAAYRFTRNQAIDAAAIAEAGFAATAEHAKSYDCLLALEDTTSLEFTHQTVRAEMGYTTSRKSATGLHAHSVLLFAPKEQQVIGLIEQTRWIRALSDYGKKVQRASRPSKEKESYKWERASQATESRLGSEMNKVISVCDREADIIDYLTYKITHQQRFIVRSMQNRCIEQSADRLYQFSTTLQPADTRKVQVK